MSDIHSCSYHCDRPECIKAQRDELRERRAQPEQEQEQEPVAWQGVHDQTDLYYRKPPQADVRPLYTTPPQRQPLTDEAIWRQYQALWPFHPAEEPRLAADMVTFARAIEAAHGIKEGT
jgi:hypothetical protein